MEPKRRNEESGDEEDSQSGRRWNPGWNPHSWLQFLFFCLEAGSASRYRRPTSIPRMEKPATEKSVAAVGMAPFPLVLHIYSVPVPGRDSS